MPFPLLAQSESSGTFASCGADKLLSERRRDPRFKAAEEAMNAAILRYSRTNDTGILTLPVVFHIVDNNPFFFSDAQVDAAIKDLNDAFSKGGAYAGSVGADTRIRFCLAKRDPEGGITTGITRTVSFFANDLNPVNEDIKLKSLVQWDPAQYINIWYIRTMHLEIFGRFQCGTWLRMYAGGYATMPPGGGPTDGIVVTALGTMLAHEMGHYLGLYHTFEGMDCRNFNCATDGDRVCDTPPDRSVNNSASCGSPENSCSSDTLSGFTSDVPDRIDNFMDYANGGCHNAFTQGQADRMRAAIATQRPGLLVNKCLPPCIDAVSASFTRDNAYPLPGAAINFTNTSTGATDYEWIVNGSVVATSAGFTTSFAAPGKYKVTLKATGAGGCYSTFTHFVFVNCGVTARFYTDKRQIASIAPKYLDSIRFTNASVNGTTYQWLIGNDKGMAEQVVSTSKNLTYVFNTPANYTVRLVATAGSCSDTTNVFPVPVTDPTPDGTLYLWSVECYQQTKLRVQYYVCNAGYGVIPRNTPVSFYDADPRTAAAKKLSTVYLADSIPGLCCGYLYTTIVDVGYRGLNTMWGVFNDSGKVVPVVLPNTKLDEKRYTDNFTVYTNFAFKVTATPPLSVLEWGDTVQLKATAKPGTVSSYAWSTPKSLSCTSCQSPFLVADSSTVKQVVATSNYGCTDTTTISVQVPPYNDFSVEINDAQCRSGDSLQVTFTLRNSFKRAVIPKALTVAFFNGDPTGSGATFLPKLFVVPDTVKAASASFTTVIKGMSNGKLYAVVNDSGKTLPVNLPSTPFLEKGYGNNFASYDYKRFFITPSPAVATLEWRDTLQLSVTGTPANVLSYAWSPAYNLSCANCQAPEIVADTTSRKRVVATSALGCADTAYVDILVPPYNDFSVAVNDVQCARGDSLFVNFTVNNAFKRPLLPKSLTVSFFNGDPRTAGAALLLPVVSLTDTLFAKQATLSVFIKGMKAGTLYAVVNDSGKVVPVSLPSTKLLEKDYTNNVTPYAYVPEALVIKPADTTVFRKQQFDLTLQYNVVNAASTLWQSGGVNSLSCAACPSPRITVKQEDTVRVQTVNAYGCLLKGTTTVKIFPPDFQVRVLETKCFDNNTALVRFSLCMNNGYDSVWKNIPVSFYDGDPSAGARRLPPVFATPATVGDSCTVYTVKIAAPSSSKITAVVNDKGDNSTTVPNPVFAETDLLNNMDTAAYVPFVVTVSPADTSIFRLSSVSLQSVVRGGPATSYAWNPVHTLSCATCDVTLATPPHTTEYRVFARNEFYCTSEAVAVVRTHTQDGLYVPSAFTPNGDGKNDVFYVLAGAEVAKLKSFAVFNRWGQQVFAVQNVPANSPAFGWDGRLAGNEGPSQVFVYYVTAVLKDGKEKSIKGTVTLIR